jgi:hypothetical protein
MKKYLALFLILFAGAALLPAQFGRAIPPTLIPFKTLVAIANEASGDMALQNEILIAGVNVNRKPEEYANGYFETMFLFE